MFIRKANSLGTGITRDLLGQYSYFFVRILLLMLTFLLKPKLSAGKTGLNGAFGLVWFSTNRISQTYHGNLHHSLRFR